MHIQLEIDVKNYKGGPQIKIYTNEGQLFDQTITEEGLRLIDLEAEFKLPNKLIIEHYGKNMLKDTLIDAEDNILDDKGYFINKIKIDDLVLENELYHFNFVTDDGLTIKENNYMGFNGKFILDIDNENLYTWHSAWQKHLVSDQEVFNYEDFKKEIFGTENLTQELIY